ncbi:MAG: hypothetical protein AAF438_22775 [Pseudomonadota bacterium]
MVSGDVPEIAEEIWYSLHPNMSLHRLADELRVPLRELVFWVCVFKRHLDVREDFDTGVYVFCRDGSDVGLSTAIASKLRKAH